MVLPRQGELVVEGAEVLGHGVLAVPEVVLQRAGRGAVAPGAARPVKGGRNQAAQMVLPRSVENIRKQCVCYSF